MRRTSLAAGAVGVLAIACSGCFGGCGENVPDGCGISAFSPGETIRDIDVVIETGATGTDEDVFFDVLLLGRPSQVFLLDGGFDDNFEAGERCEFDLDPEPFRVSEVAGMQIRVEDHVFGTSPLVMDLLSVEWDGDFVWRDAGGFPPLDAGESLDLACPPGM